MMVLMSQNLSVKRQYFFSQWPLNGDSSKRLRNFANCSMLFLTQALYNCNFSSSLPFASSAKKLPLISHKFIDNTV